MSDLYVVILFTGINRSFLGVLNENIAVLNQFIEKNYYFSALFRIVYVLLRPCEFKLLHLRFISLGLFSLYSSLNGICPFEVLVLVTKDADYQ